MSERKLNNILVTGGSGFIGSNFIRYLFRRASSGQRDFEDCDFTGRVVNADCLTYAGNGENLDDIENEFGKRAGKGQRYFFEKVDICQRDQIERILRQYEIDTIVHFAAESHVDRSILGPEAFVRTNIEGTFVLLDCAKQYWNVILGNQRSDVLFHHISTDEVYGSLGSSGFFSEESKYDPHSPYSASKAASDHLVSSYWHTYALPITLSNCSNNYGPYQFPEKLIPLMILNMKQGKPLPVYGKGENVRDWIYVEDHNRAVWQIMKRGKTGEKYNIGGENELKNIDLLKTLIDVVSAELSGKSCALDEKNPAWFKGKSKDELKEKIASTITYVKDRPGHDLRYAIDCSKIKKELGWQQKMTFEQGLALTVKWYTAHDEWTGRVLSGEYLTWIDKNYASRQ